MPGPAQQWTTRQLDPTKDPLWDCRKPRPNPVGLSAEPCPRLPASSPSVVPLDSEYRGKPGAGRELRAPEVPRQEMPQATLTCTPPAAVRMAGASSPAFQAGCLGPTCQAAVGSAKGRSGGWRRCWLFPIWRLEEICLPCWGEGMQGVLAAGAGALQSGGGWVRLRLHAGGLWALAGVV